jgi:hypothetical protein
VTRKKVENENSPLKRIQMDLPSHVSSVFINIGSNLDPFLPPAEYGDSAWTIAFEPIVGCDIKKHKQLMVVNAAVAAQEGLTTMYLYNSQGRSSSLSKPSYKGRWNTRKGMRDFGEVDGSVRVVPLLTVENVLASIPRQIQVPLVKTDMQGHDFAAVSAGAQALVQRVDYLFTEVYLDDISTYQDVHNDFCRDWLPFMSTVGYEFVYLKTQAINYWGEEKVLNTSQVEELCREQFRVNGQHRPTPLRTGCNESDVLWRRRGAPVKEFKFQNL